MASQDIYSKLTDQIIASLEAGTRPWFKPWANGDHPAGTITRPLRANGTPYRGINVLVLWMTAESNGYSNPYWMTFKQAKELGGHVRKGEKGTLVVFWNRKTTTEDNGDERTVAYMRTYIVFNCDQIADLPEKYQPKAAEVDPKAAQARITEAETFFGNLGMDLRHGGNKAFYSPSGDYVQMPTFEDFNTPEAYYGTLGHESVHWTKAAKRLDRELGQKRWGDDGYAVEELVAELGSAYLAADLGIAPQAREENASYIAHWLKILKDDKRAIFTAAGYAERAVTYLHDQQPDNDTSDELDEAA